MMLIYGQGCDIPDIDVVVQWKAPASTSSWVQCAGRVVCSPGCEGLVVLLVEKTTFETNPVAMSEKAAPTKAN
jgi:superfamily II DNA or RNA helicase